MCIAEGNGVMTALGTSEENAQKIINDISNVWIAAINSPCAVTVAGSPSLSLSIYLSI